jgi:hypothetical protein
MRGLASRMCRILLGERFAEGVVTSGRWIDGRLSVRYYPAALQANLADEFAHATPTVDTQSCAIPDGGGGGGGGVGGGGGGGGGGAGGSSGGPVSAEVLASVDDGMSIGPVEELDATLGAHVDGNLITLLWADNHGLEVLDPNTEHCAPHDVLMQGMPLIGAPSAACKLGHIFVHFCLLLLLLLLLCTVLSGKRIGKSSLSLHLQSMQAFRFLLLVLIQAI